jgi:hypothetical protein
MKPVKIKGEFTNQIKSLKRNISEHLKLLRRVSITKKENDEIDDEVLIEDTTPEFEQLKKENTIKIKQKY